MKAAIVVFLFAALGVAAFIGYRATEPEPRQSRPAPYRPAATLPEGWGDPNR